MQNTEKTYVLGIDIGSTTVKIAIISKIVLLIAHLDKVFQYL